MMRLLEHDIHMPGSDPETWEALVSDCARCVGKVRILLHDSGVTDPEALQAVERIGTAALLTRLWRDVRIDVMEYDRLTIPADVAAVHGLDLALVRKALRFDTGRGCAGDARDGSCDCGNIPNSAMRVVLPAFRATLQELVRRTDVLWDEELHGLDLLPEEIRRKLRILELESRATLSMIARRRYDTLSRRPALGPLSRTWLRLRQRLSR